MKNISNIFKDNKIYTVKSSQLILRENIIEGNLNSELVVFYATNDNAPLAENLKVFLMKMLGAIQYDLGNSLIINNSSNVRFNDLQKLSSVKKVIFFGSTRKDAGINLNIKRYKIFNIQNIECLFVDNIDLIIGDQKRKSALWSLMKQMFQ